MSRLPMPALRSCAAALTAATFLCACTRQEVRAPVEVRHYEVDWERTGAPPMNSLGLRVRGIVMTPTQWPLEASLKRLFKGDFHGVLDSIDLKFQSSRIPAGVLEDLYGLGLVPAYVRVENPSSEARQVSVLDLVVVRDHSGTELAPADPDELPRTFTRVDVGRTLLAAASVVLIVAIIVAGRDGRIDVNMADATLRVPGQVLVETTIPVEGRADTGTEFAPAPSADRALLRTGALAPGEAREGIVLFRHRNLVVDWSSARVVPR